MVLRHTCAALPLPLPGMLDPPCLARLSPCSEAFAAVHQGTGQQDMVSLVMLNQHC